LWNAFFTVARTPNMTEVLHHFAHNSEQELAPVVSESIFSGGIGE